MDRKVSGEGLAAGAAPRGLHGIEPREVMCFFDWPGARHRCSQHEKDATDYIVDFADARGLEYHRDPLDNIAVKKTGTAGDEASPTISPPRA